MKGREVGSWSGGECVSENNSQPVRRRILALVRLQLDVNRWSYERALAYSCIPRRYERMSPIPAVLAWNVLRFAPKLRTPLLTPAHNDTSQRSHRPFAQIISSIISTFCTSHFHHPMNQITTTTTPLASPTLLIDY